MVNGKVAIVTAAGKGIGGGIAQELKAAGFALALMSNAGGAIALAEDLGGLGLTGSVTSLEDLESLVHRTMDAYGRIDVVVNNTGHPPKGSLLEISDDDWHTGLDMLLLNVVRMARLVTPIMQRQGGGAIINISTFSAFEPSLAFPVSSSLRAALGGFARLYADQYGPDNIRMNNVLPGFTDNYPVSEGNLAKIPLGRYALVTEIAKTVRFLASADGAYITGQNLRVDGGITRSV
jgi:NAD(P)-dependent dehydrogenase (short-subunit alcohol dehydrogenase family)